MQNGHSSLDQKESMNNAVLGLQNLTIKSSRTCVHVDGRTIPKSIVLLWTKRPFYCDVSSLCDCSKRQGHDFKKDLSGPNGVSWWSGWSVELVTEGFLAGSWLGKR
ncbi:hypothetical protein J6590_017619 [Homalodisca vitripennis]|nr:hypothetical protein J6590_017619 [Homalodisca vitripennis]